MILILAGGFWYFTSYQDAKIAGFSVLGGGRGAPLRERLFNDGPACTLTSSSEAFSLEEVYQMLTGVIQSVDQ